MAELCLPRYHYVAGQELTYEGVSLDRGKNLFSIDHPLIHGTGSVTQVRRIGYSRRSVTAWVLEVLPNGSADILLHIIQEEVIGSCNDVSFFADFRLSPDGHLSSRANQHTRRQYPFWVPLFPLLPETPEQRDCGWQEDAPGDHTTYYWKTSPYYRWMVQKGEEGHIDLDLFMIQSASGSPIPEKEDPDNPYSRSAMLYFDLRLGMPALLETDGVCDDGHYIETIRLTHLEQRDAGWIHTFRKQFDTLQEKINAFWSIQRDTALFEERYAEWLKDFDLFLQDTTLNAHVQSAALSHRDCAGFSARRIRDELRVTKNLVDQPSPEWEALDMDGVKRSLRDYRGKYLLLDFWGAGCMPCISSMPDMNRIAEHYADKPFAIVGVTPGFNKERIQKVIQEQQLRYPTLFDTTVQKLYEVNSAPTFILIDPDGIIRRIERGAEPDHFNRMVTLLDPYLAGNT